ncbi:CAP domain-containing protein [Noviherbaspirillum sp. 17J57-3]|uniref:CAP domain-containing protein n=1 Tax=Noviherbaspirillum galbum TaxID=2709383 RepID=A0A6B3SS11_9BURK|nr:CAP domain-containing protein [Noviherbaspirillum galbum]
MLARINQARASSRACGATTYQAAGPVTWNARLFDAAAAHAQDMAANNYFSHVSLDGTTFSQRITAAGYAWSAVGENIAAGQTTPAEVMAAWLASPGHCANIMNAAYTEVAVACVRNDASQYKWYWAMELGHPQ